MKNHRTLTHAVFLLVTIILTFCLLSIAHAHQRVLTTSILLLSLTSMKQIYMIETSVKTLYFTIITLQSECFTISSAALPNIHSLRFTPFPFPTIIKSISLLLQ